MFEVKYECLSKSNQFVEMKVRLCAYAATIKRHSKVAGKQKSKSTSTADREVYVVDKGLSHSISAIDCVRGKVPVS